MNAALLATTVAWGGWCLWYDRGWLHAWVVLRRAYAGLSPSAVLGRQLLPALGRHALVLAGASLAWLALAGLGAPLVRWLVPRTSRPWERLALGLLLGFAALGTWNAGLALTGLFIPSALFAALAVPLILGLGWSSWRAAWRSGVPAPPTRWIYAGFIPVAIAILLMLLPDSNGDVLWVHLALPWQALHAHKLTAEGTSVVMQYPMLAEMVYGVAIAAGNDAWAHFLQFAPFAASVVLLAGWCRDEAGPVAGWLAAGLVLSFGMTGSLAIVAKNDLVLAAFVVAGAVSVVRGRAGLAAVLLGCAGATKFNGMVLLPVAGVLLVVRRFRRARPAWLAAAGLPLVPWLGKNYLMMGDPVWPTLARWIPGALWDPESAANLRLLTGPWDVAGRLAAFPRETAQAFVDNHLAFAIGLPWLVVGLRSASRAARLLASFAAVGLVALWLFLPLSTMRYGLPLFILLGGCFAVVVTVRAHQWSSRVRRWGLALGMVAGWIPLGAQLVSGIEPGLVVPWMIGRISNQEYLAGRLSTYADAVRLLAPLPDGGRFMPVGLTFSYHLPGRMMAERTFSRTWGWALARDAATARDILRRVRQTGCRYLLDDVIGEDAPNVDASAYPWTDRALAVWRDFVGRGLEPAGDVTRMDARLGGFCLYRIRPALQERAPKRIAYLPGIRSLVYGVTLHGGDADGQGWLDAALALQRRVPGVDSVDLLVAGGYRRTHQWARAYAAYLEPCSRGVANLDSLPGLAEAAAFIGKEGEALRWWDRAVALNPAALPVDAVVRRGLHEIATHRRTTPVIR